MLNLHSLPAFCAHVMRVHRRFAHSIHLECLYSRSKCKVYYNTYYLYYTGNVHGISRTVLSEDALVPVRRLRELQSGERISGHVAELDGDVSLELYRSLHHASQFSVGGSVQETNQSHAQRQRSGGYWVLGGQRTERVRNREPPQWRV